MLAVVNYKIKNNLPWKSFPQLNEDLMNLRELLHSMISSYGIRREKIENFVRKAKQMLQKTKEERKTGIIVFIKALTPNLWRVENSELRCVVFLWKRPEGSRLIRENVLEFLLKKQLKPDVVVIDPPYKIFSENPVRGPRIS
eukprot:snap_masked-scaffold_1-processed-gene-16.58-mRNA-1 protein AED:1.00 eAED:1.00 QI:0/-1/0/0/-1/1/1/0/141